MNGPEVENEAGIHLHAAGRDGGGWWWFTTAPSAQVELVSLTQNNV